MYVMCWRISRGGVGHGVGHTEGRSTHELFFVLPPSCGGACLNCLCGKGSAAPSPRRLAEWSCCIFAKIVAIRSWVGVGTKNSSPRLELTTSCRLLKVKVSRATNHRAKHTVSVCMFVAFTLNTTDLCSVQQYLLMSVRFFTDYLYTQSIY